MIFKVGIWKKEILFVLLLQHCHLYGFLIIMEKCFNSVDRLWRRKSELILIACNFFVANSRGGDTGIDKGYFLDGVNNGINYHFRMTKGTYYMLQKEKSLRLQVQKGLLGGLYVSENPCPNNMKRTLKRDRKNWYCTIFFDIDIWNIFVLFSSNISNIIFLEIKKEYVIDKKVNAIFEVILC